MSTNISQASSSSSLGSLLKRPTLARQDTDVLLSYYGSSDAGQAYAPALNKSTDSLASDYSSTYSSDSMYDSSRRETTRRVVQNSSRRRSRLPSEGSEDRRRTAVVQTGETPRKKSLPHKDELNADIDVTPQKWDTLRSRRGLSSELNGLALVAPPDASPKNYTYLTPPSTASSTGGPSTAVNSEDKEWVAGRHYRAKSEATETAKQRAKASRPTILPGNTPTLERPHLLTTNSTASTITNSSDDSNAGFRRALLKADMTTKARTPILTPDIGQGKDINAPVAAPVVVPLGDTANRKRSKSEAASRAPPQILIHDQMPTPPLSSSLYVTFQPGQVSPPPRAILTGNLSSAPPPRPPRLHSPPPSRRRGDTGAVVQPMQLSNSSNHKSSLHSLGDEPPKSSLTTLQSNRVNDEETSTDGYRHRREGAFPPSQATPSLGSSFTTSSEVSAKNTSSEEAISDIGEIDESGLDLTRHLSPSMDIPRPNILTNHPDNSWVSITPPASSRGASPLSDTANPDGRTPSLDQNIRTSMESRAASSDSGRRSFDLGLRPSKASVSRSSSLSGAPSPPPKSPKGLKAGIASLKRFSSIPRPSSLKSNEERSQPSTHSTTPSPPPQSPQNLGLFMSKPRLPVKKIKGKWPAAMSSGDVPTRKTVMDRCIGYAEKINELYLFETDLRDWLEDVRQKKPNQLRDVIEDDDEEDPSPIVQAEQPRKTSRSSVKSEVTFPRRADTTTATDLTLKKTKLDDSPPAKAPPLPYPSLAARSVAPIIPTRTSSVSLSIPPAASSNRTLMSPVTPKGGFFSSLGRKASMRSNKPPVISPSVSSTSSSGGKVLLKSPPTPNTRQIALPPTTTPNVPGGPRARLPSRAQRSQTIQLPPLFDEKNQDLTRSPSLFNLSSDGEMSPTKPKHHTSPSITPTDVEFSRQVDKLSDLLPQAERSVLAGYLRRAGQDILAIGQYLEDEKNGCIRRN